MSRRSAATNPITNIYDFNRDGAVGTADITLDQTHGTTNSTGIGSHQHPDGRTVRAAAGAATSAVSVAPMASGNASVASALVSSSQSPAPPTIPPWIVNRLAHLDLNHGPIATYFEHLAHENTAKSRAILVKADQVADALGLDDELLDGLLAKLGLE